MTALQELKKRTVYFYSPGEVGPMGSGSAMRQFTNLRAYLDLGFDVEVIQFVNRTHPKANLPARLPTPEQWSQVAYQVRPSSIAHRLAFYLGFPRSLVLETLFPAYPFVAREMSCRVRAHPHAIHHFEYDDMASAALDFPGAKTVFSHHDIFSHRIPLLWEMRAGGPVRLNRYQRVRLHRLRQAEDWVARRQHLILNIALHENQEFCQRGYANAEFFPMSWPDEKAVARRRAWMAGGVLRLLHLGSVEGFLGFDSLHFLLGHVFPLLSPDSLQNIELLVAGRLGDSDFTRQIRQLAAPYPQVKFLGFVDDLKSLYAETDLQVVGGTRATGLRTRIIESFVYGLPALSTVESARGVAYLRDDGNILLAQDAPGFAAALQSVTPAKLEALAQSARQTYAVHYSRSVAAGKLAELLQKYL